MVGCEGLTTSFQYTQLHFDTEGNFYLLLKGMVFKSKCSLTISCKWCNKKERKTL